MTKTEKKQTVVITTNSNGGNSSKNTNRPTINGNNANDSKTVVKNSDKYVPVIVDRNKRTKGLVGSPSFLRLQSESEMPPVDKDTVTIDTSKCRSNIDVVRKCVQDLGWREFPYGRKENNCDLFWNAINFNETSDLHSGYVNKLPGTIEIFSKSNLFRTLDIMKSWFPDEYDFYPRTWFLPQQQYQFNASFKYMQDKKTKHKPTFIVKPSEGSQGEGIYLLRDPSQYTQQGNRKHVIQEYLTDVFLINDYKFDLRVYVVLRSINPLVIHICKEGLARFSTIPYEQPNAKNINESFMHLTNYSLNKKSSTFDKSQKENEGSKRKLSQVFKVLQKKGCDSEKLWREIEEIVCKTILAVIGDLKVEYNSHIPHIKTGPSCFQIFGFDILLLKDLKPMLLEVNSNPSLRIDCEQEVSPGVMGYVLSPKDEEVKRPLIQDTLMLVAPPHKYTHRRRKRKRQKSIPKPEQVLTNRPTALVIMSETQDISERLLSFDINHTYTSTDIEESEQLNNTAPQIIDQAEYSASSNHNQDQVESTNGNTESESNSNVSIQDNSEEDNSNQSNTTEEGAVTNRIVDSETSNEIEESEGTNDDEESVVTNENGVSDEPENNQEYEESCLKEIYPSLYGAECQHLHMMDILSKMFMSCLSVRGSSRLTSSAFRLFTRKSKIISKGITNATVDLIYIDMQRKWEHFTQDKTTGSKDKPMTSSPYYKCPNEGLNFNGFVDACHELAKKKFPSNDKLEMMQNFIDYCQQNIESFNKRQALEEEEKKTLLTRRQQSQRTTIFPQFSSSNLTESTLHDLYGQSLRKEYLTLQQKKVSAFMMAKHKRNYQPHTRLNIKTRSAEI